MPTPDRRHALFPALLKHWRHQSGLSQLDLALAAGVSARHLSFLETGRSTPSAEMVLVLAHALAVPLREVNTLLRAAGHEPYHDESAETLPAAVLGALALAKAHHEPFPLVVVDRTYDVVDLNEGAQRLFGALLGPGAIAPAPATEQAGAPVNLARLTFDPAGAQPLIVNFEQVGRELLWRIHREVLADPGDGELRALLDDLLAMDTVGPAWRHVDLLASSDPTLVLHLRTDGHDLRFVAMVTAFQAPQNLLVEQLRIETWLPADEETARACHRLAEA